MYLSVLLQTFFSACRKVIFDLMKNRRGYKNHLHGQMDDIDKEAKNFRWGMDPYVNLSKYLPMRDIDLTFMALSKDEFAKIQYMRYISHLHSEIQAQWALR